MALSYHLDLEFAIQVKCITLELNEKEFLGFGWANASTQWILIQLA